MRGRNRHTYALPKSLAEWAGCCLNPWSQAVLRMSRRLAVKLTEVFDLFERKIVSRQLQQRIKEHGTMPTGKDESVASRPLWIAWIMAQVARPQRECHR